MILCKTSPTMRKRDIKTVCISLDEMPKRPEYTLKSTGDWTRLIKKLETMIRTSLEYRQYMKFLKENMDFNRCAVLQGIQSTPEKHYTIEIHHTPFTLFDIVQIVITKHLDEKGGLNLFEIAQEVMQLHYDGKVGLIPLTATMHELVHNGKIFIPLNLVYQDYVAFVNEYEPWMLETTKSKILDIATATEKCMGTIQDFGNVLHPEFVYLNVDGFEFPTVPDEWGHRVNLTSIIEDSNTEGEDALVYRIGDELPEEKTQEAGDSSSNGSR